MSALSGAGRNRLDTSEKTKTKKTRFGLNRKPQITAHVARFQIYNPFFPIRGNECERLSGDEDLRVLLTVILLRFRYVTCKATSGLRYTGNSRKDCADHAPFPFFLTQTIHLDLPWLVWSLSQACEGVTVLPSSIRKVTMRTDANPPPTQPQSTVLDFSRSLVRHSPPLSALIPSFSRVSHDADRSGPDRTGDRDPQFSVPIGLLAAPSRGSVGQGWVVLGGRYNHLRCHGPGAGSDFVERPTTSFRNAWAPQLDRTRTEPWILSVTPHAAPGHRGPNRWGSWWLGQGVEPRGSGFGFAPSQATPVAPEQQHPVWRPRTGTLYRSHLRRRSLLGPRDRALSRRFGEDEEKRKCL